MRITVITDSSSWMNPYSENLAEMLRSRGANVNLVCSKNDIKKGDILFLLSCFQLVNKEVLDLNKHNIVVHASALPQGKGWSPTTWQILEDKDVIPLTLFEASEKMDSGNIYFRDMISLKGNELLPEIRAILGKKIVDMCVCFFENHNNSVGQKQIGEESFYRRRKPEDSALDIDKTIRDQFNLLRVVDNDRYPAYFEIFGRKYVIKIYGE